MSGSEKPPNPIWPEGTADPGPSCATPPPPAARKIDVILSGMEPLALNGVKQYLMSLQERICAVIEELDGEALFDEDVWEGRSVGGGRSRVLYGGRVFEQAGASFSQVRGDALPASATADRCELIGRPFQAMGVSLVIHPENPFVPTSHMNVRFFSVEGGEGEPVRSPVRRSGRVHSHVLAPPSPDGSTIGSPPRKPGSGAVQSISHPQGVAGRSIEPCPDGVASDLVSG